MVCATFHLSVMLVIYSMSLSSDSLVSSLKTVDMRDELMLQDGLIFEANAEELESSRGHESKDSLLSPGNRVMSKKSP